MMFGIQYSNQKARMWYITNGFARYVADISKERLVARGFYKKEGINSEETLTP